MELENPVAKNRPRRNLTCLHTFRRQCSAARGVVVGGDSQRARQEPTRGDAAVGAGEVLPPPVFRDRRLGIQGDQGRGGLGLQVHCMSGPLLLILSDFIVNYKGGVFVCFQKKNESKAGIRVFLNPEPSCFGIKTGSGKPAAAKSDMVGAAGRRAGHACPREAPARAAAGSA